MGHYFVLRRNTKQRWVGVSSDNGLKNTCIRGAIQKRHALVETLNQRYFERTDSIETH